MKRLLTFAALIGATLPRGGLAQQATDGPAAVQPGKGQWAVRQVLRYDRYDDANTAGNRGAIDQLTHETVAAYGFARDWAAMVHVPLLYREVASGGSPALGGASANEGWGVGDINVMLQHRFWQSDRPGTDTARAAVLGGVELPSGDPDFSTGSVDPFLGLAYTQIRDRHGINASAIYKSNTGGIDRPVRFDHGSADSLRLDGSYLYRLEPAAYTAQTAASSYLQIQAIGRYETQGDHEVLLSPGYLYEATNWAFEATLRLPVLQALDDRPELDVGLTVGLRYLF